MLQVIENARKYSDVCGVPLAKDQFTVVDLGNGRKWSGDGRQLNFGSFMPNTYSEIAKMKVRPHDAADFEEQWWSDEDDM